MNLHLNGNQECSSQAQWCESKLASEQMMKFFADNSIIYYQNSPWHVIHKQAFFFLLLRKSAVFFAPTLCNFVTPCPHALPCASYFKNEEEKKKNEAFLPSEKEESQTLARALISLQMHTMSQVISHSTTRESKSVRKGRRTQDLLQNHAIFTSHKLFPHTHSQDLTWQMPSQGRGSSLRRPSPHPRFIHPNLNGWNPTDKARLPTPHTVT